MAGQGTLADEVVLSGHGPFDAAYLQIGGGGTGGGRFHLAEDLLAGHRNRRRGRRRPGLDESRAGSGQPVALEQVDLFCDGTAVRKAGELPFEICRDTLDRMETVTQRRGQPRDARAVGRPALHLRTLRRDGPGRGAEEPRSDSTGKTRAGGALRREYRLPPARPHRPVRRSRQPSASRTLRVRIPERAGNHAGAAGLLFRGPRHRGFPIRQNRRQARPGRRSPSTPRIRGARMPCRQNSMPTASHGRTSPERWTSPSAPSRCAATCWRTRPSCGWISTNAPGALHDFLDQRIRGNASLCYFNYRQSGERIGRALIGLDFADETKRREFLEYRPRAGRRLPVVQAGGRSDQQARLTAL